MLTHKELEMLKKLLQLYLIAGLSTFGFAAKQEGARSECEGGDRLHKKCSDPAIDKVMIEICSKPFDGKNWLPEMNNCDTINRDMVELLCTKACVDAHTCYISGPAPNYENAHNTGFVFLDGGKQICWVDYGQMHVCAPWIPGAKLTSDTLPQVIQDAMKKANYKCSVVTPDLPKDPRNKPDYPSTVAKGLQDCLNMCGKLIKDNSNYCNSQPDPSKCVKDYVESGKACNKACYDNCSFDKCPKDSKTQKSPMKDGAGL